MTSREIFEVPSYDDVKRERVRGIFAIAAIAVLYYLRSMNGNKPIVLIPAIPAYNFGPITTDGLMMVWAFYVVTMAMTLSAGKFTTHNVATRIVRVVLMFFYAMARATYNTAVFVLLMTLLFWAGLAFWASPLLLAMLLLLIVFFAIMPKLTSKDWRRTTVAKGR